MFLLFCTANACCKKHDRNRALEVLFDEADVLLSVYFLTGACLVHFTGCGLFLLCYCIFRLGINEWNYTKNYCQYCEYLPTSSFIVRKLDQLGHAVKGAGAFSSVLGCANKYWFNV